MAYDLAPGRRIPIDIDGSMIKYYKKAQGTYSTDAEGTAPPGGMTTATQTERAAVTEADVTTGTYVSTSSFSNAACWIYVVFSEAMDLDGIFAQLMRPHGTLTKWAQISYDTTNGEDGTWSSYSLTDVDDSESDSWREDVTDVALIAVTGMRFYVFNSGLGASVGYSELHFYGEPNGGRGRLEIVDADASDVAFTAPIDFGDTPRGQISTHSVKVKNNHATERADTVSFDVEALLATADDWVTFSTNGGTSYTAGPISLGNIAASGGLSTTIIVKQVVPEDADIGPFDARLVAEATSWT